MKGFGSPGITKEVRAKLGLETTRPSRSLFTGRLYFWCCSIPGFNLGKTGRQVTGRGPASPAPA